MSKRVLLITASYYPMSMAGAHRPAKMAKYLPQFGWTPEVLCGAWTPENSEGTYDPGLAARPDTCPVTRVPYPPLPPTKPGRGFLYGMQILFPYHIPWSFTRGMVAAGRRLLAEKHFDAIWSTSNPPTVHYVAACLARRHGLPWVADFRDIPDQDFHPLRLWYIKQWERWMCRRAKAFTTVAQPLVERLKARHDMPVHVITNGFDPEDYPAAPPVRADRFTIRHTGTIYPYAQDPRPLFAALDLLEKSGQVNLDDFLVEFYDAPRAVMASWLQTFSCRRVVKCMDRLGTADVIRCQQEAAILLLLSINQHDGIVPIKTFDYLAARRPVLDVPGSKATGAVLSGTKGGIGAGDPTEIAAILASWYKEWRQTGTVAYTGVPEEMAVYTRRHLAGRLAQVLDEVSTES
jgi:glycosyltransferase involved in cell wall biosynthesis